MELRGNLNILQRITKNRQYQPLEYYCRDLQGARFLMLFAHLVHTFSRLKQLGHRLLRCRQMSYRTQLRVLRMDSSKHYTLLISNNFKQHHIVPAYLNTLAAEVKVALLAKITSRSKSCFNKRNRDLYLRLHENRMTINHSYFALNIDFSLIFSAPFSVYSFEISAGIYTNLTRVVSNSQAESNNAESIRVGFQTPRNAPHDRFPAVDVSRMFLRARLSTVIPWQCIPPRLMKRPKGWSSDALDEAASIGTVVARTGFRVGVRCTLTRYETMVTTEVSR